jgi:hypothetical protein
MAIAMPRLTYLEQEKRLKYLNLVANSVVFQNAFDISFE